MAWPGAMPTSINGVVHLLVDSVLLQITTPQVMKMRIQKSGYKSERAAYNETLYWAGNAFMKIRGVVMVSALAFALCGCPIAGGTKFTVGGTVTGVHGT